jgi:HAD superfamily hydrolase (TIGR01509 family)
MPDDRRYAAVLLDFRGILVGDPPASWWVDEAASRLGLLSEDEKKAVRNAFDRIGDLPGFAEDEARVDISLEAHREVVMGWLLAVGLDANLAEVLYGLDFEPAAWPVFPDAPEVVQAIHDRGVKMALVSDFHVDLRPHLSASGIELDAHVISFEHGFQKPDPRMFTTALEALQVEPRQALMVGDRVTHDGGAAAVGIDTLILPDPPSSGSRGLDVVLDMLG